MGPQGDAGEHPQASDPLGGLLGGLLGPGADGRAGASSPGKLLRGVGHGSLPADGARPGAATAPSSPGDLLGGLLGSAGAGLRSAAAGAETRITTRTNPDGSICTNTLELQDGRVKRNVTRCTRTATAARRLQLGGIGASPEDDLWVLGGVFLERFVTVFDFDHGRMGFGEPAEDIAPHLDTTGLDQVLSSAVEPAGPGPVAGAGARLAPALALLGAGAAVAALVARLLLPWSRRGAPPAGVEPEE